jgi:hypothetical protein
LNSDLDKFKNTNEKGTEVPSSGDEANEVVLMDSEEFKETSKAVHDSTSEIEDVEESAEDVVQSNEELTNSLMTSVSDKGELDYVVAGDAPSEIVNDSGSLSDVVYF